MPKKPKRAPRGGNSIWYIHPYAGGPNQGTHIRPYELCRAWNRDHGCRARVIFPSYHHCLVPRARREPFFSLQGVPFHAVPTNAYRGNGWGRLWQMFSFSLKLEAFGKKLVQRQPRTRPDVVIVSSPHPFCADSAWRLARAFQAKFVFEIRDLWPLSLIELGQGAAWHPLVQLAAWMEKRALNHSDVVASVLPRGGRYLKERGFGQKPFVWVPNGLRKPLRQGREPCSREVEEIQAVLKQWRKKGKLILIYIGSMGPPNGVSRLIESLNSPRLQALKHRLGVMLVGSGSEKERLQKRTTEIPVCWSRGAIPADEIPEILGMADFAYAGLRHLPKLYQYGVSLNKIPEYMAAGLPVILPCAPCGDPVSESGAGLVKEVPGRDSLAGLIRTMIVMSESIRKKMGQKGRNYIKQNYSYTKIAKNYLEEISST